MTESNNYRNVLAAALSAHVSELRLYWRETGLSCQWLVPDGEHCYVDAETIQYLRKFRDTSMDTIVNAEVRERWIETGNPILESEDAGSEPFPLRKLTWLLRVVESPHRDDLTIDAWNLYLWSVRISALPELIASRASKSLGDVRIADLDSLVSAYVSGLKEEMPAENAQAAEREKATLISRFNRLRRFKNLIFYGVANIGKANLSKELIRNWSAMTGREIGMHCVTVFHANSSYEDMVERRIDGDDASVHSIMEHCTPRVIAHHINDARYFFEPFANENIQEGLFLSLCRAAAYNPDMDYVFMVDCIDRARLDDVFGEVSHMFDSYARVPWRGSMAGSSGAWDLEAEGARSIRLSQSGRIFFIPSNVYILGTATEEGLFMSVDDHLFQTFAVEYLPAKSADELRSAMLSGHNLEEYARLEPYAEHSVQLWDEINTYLAEVGGHKNIIGYGPLLSMCHEILRSGDVIEANNAVLDTWRYRMLPPVMAKMEGMLRSGDETQCRILERMIECLNQSWLRISVSAEGIHHCKSIYIRVQ